MEQHKIDMSDLQGLFPSGVIASGISLDDSMYKRLIYTVDLILMTVSITVKKGESESIFGDPQEAIDYYNSI